MKKGIAALAALLSAIAMAGPTDPYDVRIVQNNSNVPSNGQLTRFLPFPGQDCFIFLNQSTLLPQCATLGTGLSVTSGVLNASQAQADWNASSGASQILNKPSIQTVALTGDYNDLTSRPTLGTAAALDVASTGDATAGQVAKGNDSRFSDARAPTSHTHPASQISDSTSVGRDVLMASDAAAARTAIGAGTSSFSGAYSDLTGKPTLATVATSGSYNDLSNKPVFDFGTPNSRSISLATAYQCTDTAKACVVTITVACPLTVSILAGATCAGEMRLGSTNAVASGSGTLIAAVQRNASGVVGLATNDYETKSLAVPVGWYFAVLQPSGTGLTIISTFDQSAN